MVFYFASPKYNPLINKVLTETDQVIAESIVGNDLFLKKTMKENLTMQEEEHKLHEIMKTLLKLQHLKDLIKKTELIIQI